METERSDSRHGHRDDVEDSPPRDYHDDDLEEKSSKHRSKDRKKSSRGDDKDHHRSKERERDRERDRRENRTREKDHERDRHRDKDKDRKSRDKIKEKAREKTRDDKDYDKERSRGTKRGYEENDDRDVARKEEKKARFEINEDVDEGEIVDDGAQSRKHASELGERILKMKEERLKKKSEGDSEILSWVNRSRKIEDKKSIEKQKAMQRLRVLEEQDNIEEESDDDDAGRHTNHLEGVKVLHGLDKVMEGGAVVLTLKDQHILADGDVNAEADMLENVEIGEQKRRNDAYKAAKKKTTYDDKFNDDLDSEKKMLPQYDEPDKDEGVTLDARGRFTGEAEKKLEELRKRIQGTSVKNYVEDLNSSGKILSDYYTEEEMLKFKKPKKKKSLRKKEKLDIDALEAEAISSGLGATDLGSRNDGRRRAAREEEERAEAEKRTKAYQSALAKADEASKLLRMGQTLPVKMGEDENPPVKVEQVDSLPVKVEQVDSLPVKAHEDEDQVFVDDDEDLYKSLERARRLALKKQEEATSGPEAIALLATSTANNQATADHNNGESQENKVVFTEMEEFVWGIQLNEEAYKPDSEDVFMDEDEQTISKQETKEETGGWTEVEDTNIDRNPSDQEEEEVVPDDTIHEAAIGKGLAGTVRLLKNRGTLKEGIDWGGRNMDKKKSKLVGVVENNNSDTKKFDIRIERTDEFGRILTPKEAFRLISHKFHGKGPGKMKQEKRQKQYYEELKLKQMKNSDTPSRSVERMREAQAQLKSPYLVLSGHVKPGQTSDPKSGFATVERDGGLTPMLGKQKVEHFLGIKRQPDNRDSSGPKRPKT